LYQELLFSFMLTSYKVTKEEILSKIKEEDIFEKYFKFTPNLRESFRNPLRADHHSDCKFKISPTTGMLKFVDYAMRWEWDCFNIVEKIYRCNFFHALDIIAEDFNLKSINADTELIKQRDFIKLNSKPEKSVITVKIRDWYDIDMEYWDQFNIDKQILILYNVRPVSLAYVNGNCVYNGNLKDPCYVYYFGNENIKLYFPLRNRDTSSYPRFYHNCPFLLQGGKQLPIQGDNIFITKALKDVMSMYSFNIPSLAPNSETILIRPTQMYKIRARFKNVYTLFDRDRTGMVMSILMKEKYNTIPLLFTKDEKKDFSDNVKHYGNNYMLDYIEHFKNETSTY